MLLIKPCSAQKESQYSLWRMPIAALWLFPGALRSPRTEHRDCSDLLSFTPQCMACLSVLVLRGSAPSYQFFSSFFFPSRSPPSASSLLAHGAFFPCVLGDLCLLLIVPGKLFAEISASVRWKCLPPENGGICFSWAPRGSSRPGLPRPNAELEADWTTQATQPRWQVHVRPGLPAFLLYQEWSLWRSLHFWFTLTVSNRRSVAFDFGSPHLLNLLEWKFFPGLTSALLCLL